MKKNNKGFMLVEAIITSVVIATAMVGFFTTFNKLYSSYNQRSKYYNVDGIYAAKATFNYLFDNDLFNKFINNVFEETQYKIIMSDDVCFYNDVVYNKNVDITNYNNATMCQEIKQAYNINKMVIVEYDKSVLKEDVKELEVNQTFKDYIEFVTGYYEVADNDTRYSYLVLTEIKNGDNYYYANLGIE